MELAEIGDLPHQLMRSWHSVLFDGEAVTYCSWDSKQSSPPAFIKRSAIAECQIFMGFADLEQNSLVSNVSLIRKWASK